METGSETGATLASFLDAAASPGLAASIDPAGLLQAGIDPVVAARELGSWVVHAYASDATETAQRARGQPARPWVSSRALDWVEFLGSLEEIGYRGFLTIWPTAGRPVAAQFQAVADRLKMIG